MGKRDFKQRETDFRMNVKEHPVLRGKVKRKERVLVDITTKKGGKGIIAVWSICKKRSGIP